MNVSIVDYGMGNIRSIVSALKYVGVDTVIVTADYETLKRSDKLILPGVGAFEKAIARIKDRNIDKYLEEVVLKDKKPILGICLGMQLLGISSEENGHYAGLGFIKGEVKRFDDTSVSVPHVGFNQVKVNPRLKLYKGFTAVSDFYFTHSYRMLSNSNINQCLCNYGEDFVASYELDNVAGVQFHPELSQHNGLVLLKNFICNF